MLNFGQVVAFWGLFLFSKTNSEVRFHQLRHGSNNIKLYRFAYYPKRNGNPAVLSTAMTKCIFWTPLSFVFTPSVCSQNNCSKLLRWFTRSVVG